MELERVMRTGGVIREAWLETDVIEVSEGHCIVGSGSLREVVLCIMVAHLLKRGPRFSSCVGKCWRVLLNYCNLDHLFLDSSHLRQRIRDDIILLYYHMRCLVLFSYTKDALQTSEDRM